MRKTLITILCLLTVAAIAGGPKSYKRLSISNVSTAAAGESVTCTNVQGDVCQVILSWSGGATSPTGNVAVVATNGVFGISQTLYEALLGADAVKPVRLLTVDTSGNANTNDTDKIRLWADNITVTVTNMNKTNANLDVYILLEKN